MIDAPRLRVLGSSLISGAAVSGLVAWTDALRVAIGATPPVTWLETADLALRGGTPLALTLLPLLAIVWAISTWRNPPRQAGAPPRGLCASARTLTVATTLGGTAALGVVLASGFRHKMGWILGALLVGWVAGVVVARTFAGLARPSAPHGRTTAMTLAATAVAIILWSASIGLVERRADSTSLASASRAPRTSGDTRPNVIFILLDALRADHLGSYGYARPTSPALDSLAERGWRFENVVAPSSWTLPAMASILTSTYPGQHGVVRRGDALPADRENLASRLSALGYLTASFNANPWLKRAFGFDSGFRVYFDLDRLGLARNLIGVRLKNLGLRRLGRIRVDPELVPDAEEITRRALAWISRNASGPFFLYLHFMDVHAPYDPPPGTHGRFCRGHAFDRPDRFLENRFRSGKHAGDAAVLEHVIELYDEDLLAADASIGRLVAALDASGLIERTHLIVTADHGEEFYEHGGTTHGSSLYQETVRVPLIIVPAEGGGAPSGATERSGARGGSPRVVRGRVTTLDLLPTILHLIGAEPPGRIEGVSLTSLMSPGASATAGDGRPVGSQLLHDGRAWVALFAGSDKLIRVRPPAPDTAAPTRCELYHLDIDPEERRDEVAAERERAKALVAALDSFEKVWGVAGANGGRAGEPVDAETMRQLGALGYLQ